MNIPRFKIEKEIGDTLRLSENISLKSFNEFNKAEKILLKDIGYEDYKIDNNNINKKRLSNSYGISTRLDAEYYLPKY